MDGVLLIDKPGGITSHDVVARLRRILKQPTVGHTGTLDPMATGLLVIVLGKATRLASLLSGHDKTYEATIRFGQASTTDDADGELVGPAAAVPQAGDVEGALDTYRGTFPQLPSSHSAKKVDGVRAYRLARANKPVNLTPVQVTVKELTALGVNGADLSVRIQATAGFYVRALARDLGATLGCGAHLVALRRIRSGTFAVADALSLAEAELAGLGLSDRVIEPGAALPGLPAVELTELGLRRVLHGNSVNAEHLTGGLPSGDTHLPVRILAGGRLVALARRSDDTLHPVAVLG
jgi:tRNA pseudouridine55 synthase